MRTRTKDLIRRQKRRSAGRRINLKGVGSKGVAVPEYYREAIESLKEYALITMDTHLLIANWSASAAAMFGYTAAESIGQSVSILFPPEDRAENLAYAEVLEAVNKCRDACERWFLRKGQERIWCHGLLFSLKDEKGAVRGFVLLIRDDTARKVQLDQLRENEERLRLAAESTGLGTWDYRVEEKKLHLSRRASELLGFQASERDPGFDQLLEKIHPEDRPRIAEKLQYCLADPKSSSENMEYRIVMPDGLVRWVQTRARVFHADGSGREERTVRVFGTVIDVTEQKLKQVESNTRSAQLEVKVKDRTSLLSAVNKELDTFAYSASHDLRAPIRKIAAFTEAILQSRESKLSPNDQSYLDRIRAAASKMEKLIDDILNLTRATKKPLSTVECDLSTLVQEIADDLKATAPARRVEFVIAENVRARGDRELLAIALRNLLDNAWKFTKKHAAARIEFGVDLIEGRTVYFVKDDGVGFDMQYAGKLFGAFQRLHPEDEFPGTGVGLGLVERVVRRHRGRLWALGHVEQGAAFYFTLNTEAA